MKETVKVAAVQMKVQQLDPEANLAKIAGVLEKIDAEESVELAVFPELCTAGYVVGRDKEFMRSYLRAAQKIPGPITEALGELARKHRIYIVAGILEEHAVVTATMYNSAVLIGPSGELVGVHRKVHIPSEEKHYFYPGSVFEVFTTALGKIGMLICADNSFPESARILSLKGAEIVCVADGKSALTVSREMYWRVVSCRAFENQNFFVACNRIGRGDDRVFCGGSCIVQPTGEYITRSEVDTEDLVRGTLRAETMYEIRTWKTRYRDRRPELYGPLCQLP